MPSASQSACFIEAGGSKSRRRIYGAYFMGDVKNDADIAPDEKSGTFVLEAGDEYEGERLDKFLAAVFPERSRTYFTGLIKSGNVKSGGKPLKASYLLRADDLIAVDIPPAEQPEILPENIPLDVLYEDDDLLVVNKPKGMVVHPSPGHYSGTLVNAVMYHCGGSLSAINGVVRPGIVHRIDKDTTGSLIVCKNDKAHLDIAEQIKNHSVIRRYRGIAIGNVPGDDGTVDKPIGRDPRELKRMAVNGKNARPAVTRYKVLERFNGYTYMEFALETGRTHQIRVHMASIGHPILGDQVYAGRHPNGRWHLEGQTLHAMDIGFIHPSTGEYLEIRAELPEYFEKLLADLRGQCYN